MEDPLKPGVESPLLPEHAPAPPQPTAPLPTAPLPTAPLPTVPPPKKKFILGCLGIGLGLFLAYVRAWSWSYGMMNAEAWGYALGGALLPALIAYAIAGRESVRNFNRFGLWFSGISLILLVLSGGHPVGLKQHIGDLMKEAAGTKPMDNSGPRNIDELVREMMRGILEDRKNFEQETAQFSAELGQLYSAGTFSSQASMQASIDAVRGVEEADERYSKRLESIPDRMQEYVNRSELSESDKRDFMEGIHKAYGNLKTLQIRREGLEAEKKWADVTVGLYEFAMSNASKIHVDGTNLVIGNQDFRHKFNERFEQAQKLRQDMAQLNTQLEAAQRTALQEAGITLKDLGLEEGNGQEKK